MRLAADIVNGVYVVDHVEGALIDRDFLEALPSVGADEVVYGEVSPEVFAIIEAEYGVDKL